MPKPIKERATTNPLGLKFHEVMREKQMTGDYKALATVFEVSTPSVYEWIDSARISKARYAKMVEWSGRSLDWWFDIPSAASAKAVPNIQSQAETNEGCHDAWQPKDWPFKKITPRQWRSLKPRQKQKAEKLVWEYIEDHLVETAQTAVR